MAGDGMLAQREGASGPAKRGAVANDPHGGYWASGAHARHSKGRGGAWDWSSSWGSAQWYEDYSGYAWHTSGDQWADDAAWGAGWWARNSGEEAAEASPESSCGKSSASWQPSFSCADEHTARVHYTKTYAVLSEAMEAHADAFRDIESFLDLGCAPGGFSSRLLDEKPSARGFGVSLPVDAGGFPVLLIHDRLQVQYANLMAIESPDDLECPAEVDACLADAQDLSKRGSKPEHGRKGGGKRNARSTGGSAASGADVGVQAACAVLGIWAMTLQELFLGFGRLREGGTMVFRFGLPSRGAREEEWYREAMDRLFGLILAHFVEVSPFKSESSHQADATFYVIARGFRGAAYAAAGLGGRLREAIAAIIACEKAKDLPGCMDSLLEFATEDLRRRVDGLLESVGRLRQIGVASRQRVEGGRSNPEAALYISPVPFNLTMQRMRDRLERYGKISHIRRRAHPVGVGADAIVQFAQAAHAKAALAAITSECLLGGNISAARLCDVQAPAAG